jgi:hypothetical protein
MRFLLILLTVFVARSALAADLPAPLKTYDDSVINAFQVMCTTEKLDFASLGAKAITMGMKLSTDRTENESAANTTHRIQAFTGNLTNGPWTLLVEKIAGPSTHAVTCGVASSVKDKAQYHAKIMSRLHLKTNGQPYTLPNGNVDTMWRNIYGPGTELGITDIKANDGVMIQLLEVTPVAH